jgi:hypothetical protein
MRQFFCKRKRDTEYQQKKKESIIWKYEDTDTTLVYDPTKSKEKQKLLEEVVVAESQASIAGTGISTKELILGRPEVSFQTTSPYSFKNFVPMCISRHHHLLTICINFHLLYPYT